MFSEYKENDSFADYPAALAWATTQSGWLPVTIDKNSKGGFTATIYRLRRVASAANGNRNRKVELCR